VIPPAAGWWSSSSSLQETEETSPESVSNEAYAHLGSKQAPWWKFWSTSKCESENSTTTINTKPPHSKNEEETPTSSVWNFWSPANASSSSDSCAKRDNKDPKVEELSPRNPLEAATPSSWLSYIKSYNPFGQSPVPVPTSQTKKPKQTGWSKVKSWFKSPSWPSFNSQSLGIGNEDYGSSRSGENHAGFLASEADSSWWNYVKLLIPTATMPWENEEEPDVFGTVPSQIMKSIVKHLLG
jgi:hypothetical protein